jgi:para-aminobenzoate synthetase component 1
MRNIHQYRVENSDIFKEQLLLWASQFQRVAFLDSHNVDQMVNSKKEYNSYELLVGVDVLSEILPSDDHFEILQKQIEVHPDWWFGFLSYDLKNQVEKLESQNHDGVQMPELHFFRPRWVFILQERTLEIHTPKDVFSTEEVNTLFDEICQIPIRPAKEPIVDFVKARISREEYLTAVQELKYHIQRGDIYEVNFCQEFYSEKITVDAVDTYRKLKAVSPTPYSCFYRLDEKYLLSASPERYLKKKGSKLVSQPIKGTARRGVTPEEDEQIKQHLFSDPKERAENIMIVDLVRNDLSRTAHKGSVHVEELCGIYSFPQVHQMISTVVSFLIEDKHFVEAIKCSYPMGSMTGAPKVRAMKLIEKFESTKRGLYSGAVGYITPEGDFDFNVVIRSLQYNAVREYLSFMVGGAITMRSIPENEYEECLLKAKAIMKVLNCNF